MKYKKVRTLLRVSSKQQLHDDDIPMQRAEAKQYIDKKPDWEFNKEYIEKAVSAYKNRAADREVLQQILADAKNKEFDVLLTYMSDRIGRQEEYSAYVAALNTLGIEVWTIKDGQLKTEEHIDKLLNYIRFWQNEGESKKTGMRVRDTQIEMVKSGKFVGGKAPFGYRLVPSGEISNHGRSLKKLEIVESDAKIVRKIYSLAIYQGFGYDRIAKQLNTEGIIPPLTDKWKSGTIASILKNPIYMGYYAIDRRKTFYNMERKDRKNWIYSEKQIPELVIISESDWIKTQEIREARKNKINAAKESNAALYEEQHNVPFSTKGKLCLVGLAECGYCGKKLKNGSYCNHWTLKSTGEEKSSFCGRYACPETDCQKRFYSQEYLESIVFSVVSSYLKVLKTIDIEKEVRKIMDSQKKEIVLQLKTIKKKMKSLEADIATLEEKIPEAIRGEFYFSTEKLFELIREKINKLNDLKENAEHIQSEFAESEIQNEELERFISKIPNWDEVFQQAGVSEKQMLLSSFIDKIVVKEEEVRIKFKIRLDEFLEQEKLVPKTIHDEVPGQRL